MNQLFSILVILFAITDCSAGVYPLAEKYLKEREYDKAIEEYEKILKKDPNSITAIKGIAQVYFKKRDYDSALIYFDKVLKQEPDDDSSIIAYWEALSKGADSLELKQVKHRIGKEALGYTLDSSYKNLTIAYHGFLLVDSSKAQEIANRLIRLYPESPKSYEIIGNLFYDSLYPVWYNDTLKVPLILRLLDRFPITEWRFTFYQYLLSSLFRLKNYEELKRIGKQMITEDSLNPFAFYTLAYYYLEAGIEFDSALELSKRAIGLEPSYQKPRNKPIEQWELEKPRLYGNSRMVYAGILLKKGLIKPAEDAIRQAIKRTKITIDDDATKGPYYYLLGLIQETKGESASAMLSFIQALIEGDIRNYWSLKAESSLLKIKNNLIDFARKSTNYQGITFTDITEEVGLKGRTESRVAFGDYNNDGYDDLLLNGNRLFKNLTGKKFDDVTEAAIKAPNSLPLKRDIPNFNGGVWADYDNDGFLDFYATSAESAGDRLFHNEGDGTFKDVTEIAGNITDNYPTEGAAWADYDNDGNIDLYLANYEDWNTHKYFPDILYKNLGDGTFKNLTKEAGIIPDFNDDRAGRGVNWGDFDDDGKIDCYVSNYRLQENFLWHNQGAGRFKNVAHRLGVAGDEVSGWYGHTIGSEWADYDNDGDLDLLVCNLAHPRYIEFSNRTMLYENTFPKGDIGGFKDVRQAAGIKYEETHSDPVFADFDNDGDLDLYITSIYEGRRSFLYENLGNKKFRDVTYLSGTRTFNGWGCAVSDFDNDGDLDLVVGSGSGVRFFRNDCENNNWLKVKIVGTKSNKAGIGTKIRCGIGNRKLGIRQIGGGKGTTSQNSLIVHFGLGKHQTVNLEIIFPSGEKRIIENIKPNQLVEVKE